MFRSEEGSSSEGSAPAVSVEAGIEYNVEIEDTGKEGDGVAKVEGFVIFVPETKVGDRVKIVIDKVKRRCAYGHKV